MMITTTSQANQQSLPSARSVMGEVFSAEVTLAGFRGHGFQIHQGQKINGLEQPVQGRWTADFCADGQVGAQEFGNGGGGFLVKRTRIGRQWKGAPGRFWQMLS